MAWAPDYLTSTQAKAFRRLADTVDDDEIADAVSMSSRAVDGACHRQFGVVDAAEARRYVGWWNEAECRWEVDVDDFMSTTGLLVATYPDGTSITTFDKLPVNASQEGRPWTALGIAEADWVSRWTRKPELTVTALWGWSAVPAAVRYACKLQMSRFFARRQSPYGVAGSPETSELRLLAKLDPDVVVGLSEGGYVRTTWPA